MGEVPLHAMSPERKTVGIYPNTPSERGALLHLIRRGNEIETFLVMKFTTRILLYY